MFKRKMFSKEVLGSSKGQPARSNKAVVRFEQVVKQARELGLDEDKRLAPLLSKFTETGHASPALMSLIEELIAERVQQLSEVPFIYPQLSDLQGEIPFAKLLGQQGHIGLRVTELFTHGLIQGASGSGKTNAIVYLARSIARQQIDGLTTIVFDTEKGDLSSIARSVDDAAILTDFADDIFVPPPFEAGSDTEWQRSVNEYMQRILSHIASLLWSNVGEFSLEMRAIDWLWDKGFFSSGRVPGVKDFIEAVKLSTVGKAYSRRGDRKLNIEDKWYLLQGAFRFFSERSCLDIERLLDHRLVVVDLSSFDEIRQQVLMVNIIEKLYFFQLKGRGRKPDKRILVIMDEALPLIRKEANTISGVPPLVSMMAKVRSTNIGFCLCVQNPSLVHPIAVGNASIHVMFRLEGTELAWASRLFQFTREQEEFVHTGLKPGMAVVAMGTRNLRPFPIAFPKQEWGFE